MPRRMTRREFVATGATVAGLATATTTFGQAPAVRAGSIRTVVVASANGNRFRNGGAVTGVQRAFEMIAKGDDVLNAVIAGVNICELDPEDTSVGYGGLPNADFIQTSPTFRPTDQTVVP